MIIILVGQIIATFKHIIESAHVSIVSKWNMVNWIMDTNSSTGALEIPFSKIPNPHDELPII